MNIAPFNTLKYANTLKAAGVPDKQAEAEAEALSEILSSNIKELATKEGLATVEAALKKDLSNVESVLKADIARLDANIAQATNKIILWVGGMIITFGASIIGILLHIGKLV